MLQDLGNPSLRKLHEEAALVALEFEELARDLGDDRVRWAPDSSSWSIAQCLEHLAITGEACDIPFRAALRAAAPRSGARGPRPDAPLRPGPLGKWLLARAGPRGSGPGLNCPLKLAPSSRPGAGVLDRFLACQALLLAAIEGADGLDLNRVRVTAPISRVLRISLGEALALATGHTRRHLDQARRVRAHPRFPA